MAAVEKLTPNADRDYASDAMRIVVDQYRLYLDSASRISDRRGTANTFLLTANTALVTVLGLAAPKGGAFAASAQEWNWLPAVAGLTLCFAWFALIRSYRALNAAKFEVIQQLEELLPVQLYEREWGYLEKGRSRLFIPMSRLEQLVPAVFGAIYLGMLLTLFLGGAA